MADIKIIIALRNILLDLPELEREFIARFTVNRLDLSTEKFTEAWVAEHTRRQEAENLASHKQKQLVSELMNSPEGKANREVLAGIFGVEAQTDSGNANSDI